MHVSLNAGGIALDMVMITHTPRGLFLAAMAVALVGCNDRSVDGGMEGAETGGMLTTTSSGDGPADGSTTGTTTDSDTSSTDTTDDGAPPAMCERVQFARYGFEGGGFTMQMVEGPTVPSDANTLAPTFLVFAGDFDGDGRDDIWCPDHSRAVWGPLGANAEVTDASVSVGAGILSAISPNNFRVADLNLQPGVEVAGVDADDTFFVAEFVQRTPVRVDSPLPEAERVTYGNWNGQSGIFWSRRNANPSIAFSPLFTDATLGTTEEIDLADPPPLVSSVGISALNPGTSGSHVFVLSRTLGYQPGATMAPYFHVLSTTSAPMASPLPSPAVDTSSFAGAFVTDAKGKVELIMYQLEDANAARLIRYGIEPTGATVIESVMNPSFDLYTLKWPMRGDLNGNGHEDVVFEGPSGALFVWFTQTDGTFSSISTLVEIQSAAEIESSGAVGDISGMRATILDLDGDGRDELVTVVVDLVECG